MYRNEFGRDLKSLTLFGGLGSKGILWAYDVVQGAQTKRAPLVRGKAERHVKHHDWAREEDGRQSITRDNFAKSNIYLKHSI